MKQFGESQREIVGNKITRYVNVTNFQKIITYIIKKNSWHENLCCKEPCSH